MPEHKFKHTDLVPLEQNPLSGHYHLLVVGTFNPFAENNDAPWFYGRAKNHFWFLLPQMMGQPSLHPSDTGHIPEVSVPNWKGFCARPEKSVIIVDIFRDVFVNLPNFADRHLNTLIPRQYETFNFQQAFQNATFDGILFTWKSMNHGTLTHLKQQYIDFFEPLGSHIMHMVTPSPAYYRITREQKLEEWLALYAPIANL